MQYNFSKLILPLLITASVFCLITCKNNAGKKNIKKDEIYFSNDGPVIRKLKLYRPKKANKKKKKSYDITDYIQFPDESYLTRNTDKAKITAAYDLADDDNNIYIYVPFYKKLHIFDKKTMGKMGEITIHFPASEYSDAEYAALIDAGQVFFDPRHLFPQINGLIINEKISLLLCKCLYPYPVYLFSLDMETGNAVLINTKETLGIELFSSNWALMGFDKKNELIWFHTESNIQETPLLYYFFKYDVKGQKFIAQNTIEASLLVGRRNHTHKRDIEIYGDEVWTYGYNALMNRNIVDLGIDKRHIDNPTEMLSYIDIEHLGTLSVPQSIIYDKPYIWIMVERKGRIQMLKLLPK